MEIPADWISEAELVAAIDVSHRNLLNWRHHDLLPTPMIRHLGVGVGSQAFYPPITIAMVRRINELRRQTRDMDEWRWRLWLDAYPIDIVRWCRQRLLNYAEIISDTGEKLFIETATRKPAKRSDPRRTFYRRLKAQGWPALMTWAVNVAIGVRPPQSLYDSASSPLAALARLLERVSLHITARRGSKFDADHPSTGVRPCGWTGSGGRFDRLPGVVILELRGAEISERRVEPSAVVDLVDEAGKIGGDVFERLVFHHVDGLDLQGFHEAFGLRIVVGITAPAH
jgi:hypothetical protein